MYLSARTDIADGPLPVSVIPGDSPFASIDLSDAADLRLRSVADCDRLMVAAATAKRMLETGGQPHGYEAGAGALGSNCVHCGRRKGDEAHAAPSAASGEAAAAPLVISDSTIAQARYFEEHPLDEDFQALREFDAATRGDYPGRGES